MIQKQVIEALREQAATDPVLNDVMHVLADYQRARHQITLAGLMQRMKKEGFEHRREEIANRLNTMGKAGLGRIEFDRNGNAKVLKDLTVKRQSLANAVIEKGHNVDLFKKRKKYMDIPVEKAVQTSPTPAPTVKQEEEPKPQTEALELSIIINGKRVNIQVPKELSAMEVSTLIARLRAGN